MLFWELLNSKSHDCRGREGNNNDMGINHHDPVSRGTIKTDTLTDSVSHIESCENKKWIGN